MAGIISLINPSSSSKPEARWKELIDDLNVCFDESYLPVAEVDQHKQLAWRVHRIINGYGRYLRQRKAGEAGVLHESVADYHTEDETDPFADLPR